ncbi:MAG: hypothetical protein RXQ68_00160 [Candidatus Nanopusillus sp.]
MSDKENLSQKLDWILKEMVGEIVKYSFTLGDWGKDIRILIYLGDNGYSVESSGVNPLEIRKFESQKIYKPHRKYIYFSDYDYTTDIYNIIFNPYIRELRKNMRKEKNIIRNMETLAIGIYNLVINSYLDSSEEYGTISIHFIRNESDYNKIDEEIKESIIFGRSIPIKYESIDQSIYQPVFKFKALKEKKKDKNDDTIGLFDPDYYKFSFTVYRINYQNF